MAKVKSYKELHTTALHRRFVSACGVALLFCWLEASLISTVSVVWSWFPFSYTGFRILALFIPCLIVFIIRLQNLHFGEITTTSDVQTLYQYFLSGQAIKSLFWYLVSSQIFAITYILSKGQGCLAWVDIGRAYERPRLNENPICLTIALAGLAVVQTVRHLYVDTDRVRCAQKEPGKEALDEAVVTSLLQGKNVKRLLMTSFENSIAATVLLVITYFLVTRSLAWKLVYPVATMLDARLPATAPPAGFLDVSSFLRELFASMYLLATLWGVSNAIFTEYMSQPPLKKSQPLTSDMVASNGSLVSRAVDANGSLINGLLRKKETLRTTSLWELDLICTHFEARRKSIFLEVDRVGGSSWTQISRQCLIEIDGIALRIKQHNTPTTDAASHSPAQSEATGLPKIASEQARQGDILVKPRADLTHNLTSLARSAGSHPGAIDPLSPVAKRAVQWSASQLVSKEQQQQLTYASAEKHANSYAVQILHTKPGIVLRDTFSRRAKAVVFGTPHSAQVNIVHAARSLATMLKASLVEDTCGVVAKDVPLVVRSLMGAIKSIRQLLNTLQPSWTDVDFKPEDRQVPEVLAMVTDLQSALEAILLAFAEYAPSLGMSRLELREAKEAVGLHSGQEMTQLRR